MSRKIIGLDIRYDSVSAVLVDSSLKENRIEAFEHVRITEQADDFYARLSPALEALTETVNIAGAVCIASLPSGQIFFRSLQVPFKERKKIRQILPFELESVLPFPVEDHVIDFQVIKPTDHHADATDLVVAGAPKTELGVFLEILASFGIDPGIIAAGGYQTALALSSLSTVPEKWLLVDIDSIRGTLFAVASGRIILVRSFIADHDAENRLGKICATIRHTLLAFDDIAGTQFQPAKIFITGSGICDSDSEDSTASCAEKMSHELDIPVEQTHLVRDAHMAPGDHPGHAWQADQMDNAFALALTETAGLKGLNFRKGPFAPRKKWLEHKDSFIKTGIIAGVVLILMVVNILSNSYLMNKKITDLNNRINGIFKSAFPDEKIADLNSQAQQMRALIQHIKKNMAISEGAGKHIRTIEILNEFGRLIPKETDINITRFVIKPDSVSISGDTDSFSSVDDMQGKLEQGEQFRKVTPHNPKKVGDRVRFKLVLEI